MISIEIDRAQMAEITAMTGAINNGTRRVLMRGINQTMNGTRTDATRNISAKITLAQYRIRDSFWIRYATLDNLSSFVRSRGTPVNLIFFQANQTARGVTARVYRDKPRFLLHEAWIMRGPGGDRVWLRTDRPEYKATYRGAAYPYGRLPRRLRLPIDRADTLRVQDVFARPDVLEPTLEQSNNRLSENLDNQLAYLLRVAG